MGWFEDGPKKERKKFDLIDDPHDASKHEKDTAKSRGGYATAGSGSKPGNKSDVVQPKTRLLQSSERIECKKTTRKSLTISLKWLEKIVKEAVETGRTPVMAFRFEDAEFAEKDWIMVERRHYEDLTQEDS